MKDMKKIILTFALLGVAFGFAGCKYDESYLNSALPKPVCYFASFQEYDRIVIVGEGMSFKIGAAIGGITANTMDRTVEFNIFNYLKKSPGDIRVLMPTSMYKINNAAYTLNSKITATIPAGSFLGYFTVNLDSAAFLANPNAMGIRSTPISFVNNSVLTIPVRITGTSIDSIGRGNDSVFVSVKYQASVDGYYLFQNTLKKEFPVGTFIDTKTEKYTSEINNNTWRFFTVGPYKVEVTSPLNSLIKSTGTSQLKFNLTVDANKLVTYESIVGMPVITPELTNVYDSKTRDFDLNFTYKKTGTPVNDTIYHVNAKMIFRNRTIDNGNGQVVNQTRDYLSYFNK